MKVSDLLTEDAETCSYNDGLIGVAKRMRKGRFRHMPGTDAKDLVVNATKGSRRTEWHSIR